MKKLQARLLIIVLFGITFNIASSMDAELASSEIKSRIANFFGSHRRLRGIFLGNILAGNDRVTSLPGFLGEKTIFEKEDSAEDEVSSKEWVDYFKACLFVPGLVTHGTYEFVNLREKIIEAERLEGTDADLYDTVIQALRSSKTDKKFENYFCSNAYSHVKEIFEGIDWGKEEEVKKMLDKKTYFQRAIIISRYVMHRRPTDLKSAFNYVDDFFEVKSFDEPTTFAAQPIKSSTQSEFSRTSIDPELKEIILPLLGAVIGIDENQLDGLGLDSRQIEYIEKVLQGITDKSKEKNVFIMDSKKIIGLGIFALVAFLYYFKLFPKIT